MIKYTPMIEQYLLVKAEVPDAFLFFRLGDFYEMFFEDAILASKELEITLTGREGGIETKIPMCGIPYHAADNYIARLIEKGYKVAICEQVETPEEAKGIVRREIVRIVTPGTLMDGKMLSDSVNNYIAAATAHEGKYGFAVCDLSTGELHVTSVELSLELLLDEFTAFSPAEMLGKSDLLDQVRTNLLLTSKPVVYTEWDDAAPQIISQHFAAELIQPLDRASLLALSLLMNYLSATQKRMLSHITQIRRYESNQFMMMDSFTRRNLELVETVRERTKKGSLLWMLDESVTSMGGRMLRRWIEKPLMHLAQIEQRLDAVDCFYRQLIIRDDIRKHLQQIYDLERLTARISYGSANGRDLLALQLSLAAIPLLRQTCLDSDSSTLKKLAQRIDLCEDVLGWISAAIVDEPPVSIRDGGIIRDGYHGYLDQLKEADRNGKQWMAELERQEREKTGIKSLKIGYNRIFGYYIEVTRSHLANLPEGTYERKQTLANAERFVTPELKEKEALILEAQEKMVDIEQELFIALREKIAGQIARLQQLAEIVAEVDVYQSLATVSAANRYKRPSLTEGFSFQVDQGRHPVVETVMKSGSFVANDTHLGEEDGEVLLITGPNMAGKSTYMRQVAIIAIMAQLGCFVPAEHANVSLIDRIFTRIGAADDLIAGQSTFMVEMMDIQVMTEKATKRSLVIIDELGRGTSTGEGMAIAQAVIEFMHNEIGCKTLVSTHFHELAHLEESLSSLRNYCMAVKESNQQVTFLRKLIPGAADTSYGIYCARIAGLPDTIIQRSYTLLSGFIARETIKTDEVKQVQQVAAALEPIVQLSLFAEADKPQQDKRKKKEELKTEQVVEELRNADIINMTPLQAMNLVYELKKKLLMK